MAVALALCGILLVPTMSAGIESAPVILIYCPKAPLYAEELGRLIRDDGRIEADIRIVDSADMFNLILHYPTVKLAIVGVCVNINQSIGSSLDRFFFKGGALIGLGFAASTVATGQAAERVFPIFGNQYVSGVFDTASRSYRMTHVKVDEDEISKGFGNFTIEDQKLVLSKDSASKLYVPRVPSEGEYKVLFRELTTRAPSVVRYRNGGVSVTFACFAGDDLKNAFSYFGRFTSTPEFETLFTNAAYWAWNNEQRYDAATSWASGYDQRFQEIEDARADAEARSQRRESGRLMQVVLTMVLSAAAIAGVYWLIFVKPSKTK